MGQRSQLHNLLVGCMDSAHSANVYFQPPETLKMQYPCIVYELSSIKSIYADSVNYIHGKQYTVTVIDRNPESAIPERILALPTAGFDRRFVSDNLNHFAFRLYY